MYLEELSDGEEVETVVGADDGNKNSCPSEAALNSGRSIVFWDAKRVLVGAGARALFYPTLLYNVVRNKIQAEFRWWDQVDEFIFLGAVPFRTDVPILKKLGVKGVITLNEPYETLVPSFLYQFHDIDHLVIPTRDYCFAPSMSDICQAVNFIHRNASQGLRTYVHCKAGRGRSTTIVICYLVEHKQMTPDVAYDYVKSIRPRVLLASSQWQAVQKYYHFKVKKYSLYGDMAALVLKNLKSSSSEDVENLMAFDDGSVVVVTKADAEGYNPMLESSGLGSEIWADLSVVYRVKVAGQAALARISCLWFRCHAHQKIGGEKVGRESSCAIRADSLGGISVDIQVY